MICSKLTPTNTDGEHRFGTAPTAYKTIAAVRVPSMFGTPDETNWVWFYASFDVVEGGLSILIGLPSLQAMKATINFCYGNMFRVIN